MAETMLAARTADDLYDRDTAAWAERQAALLRARRFGEVDWDNVIAEIDDVAGRDQREIISRLSTVVEHWLKLDHSPAQAPRRGWAETITREAAEVASLLRLTPTLANAERFAACVDEARRTGAQKAVGALRVHGELAGRAMERDIRSAADAIGPDTILDEDAWPKP